MSTPEAKMNLKVYFWDTLKWNYRRFLMHRGILDSADAVEVNDSYCARTLATVPPEFGKRGILLANLALFTAGLLWTSAADCIQILSSVLLLRLFALGGAAFFFIAKFDAWRLTDHRNLFKLIYIAFSCGNRSLTTLTYIFLIVFENLMAEL